MKNLEKREVRSHNKVRKSARTFAENKVLFAPAEQLWFTRYYRYFRNI